MDDVTGWVVSAQRTEYGGNAWIGAAVRILREVDETKTNKYHLVAEYSYYSFSNTISENLLIYKLNLNTQNYDTERINIYGSGIKGTIITKDLGWYGYDTLVSSGTFNCKWNRDSAYGGGTFYSNDIQVTYRTPKEPSLLPLPSIDCVVETGDNFFDSSATIQYNYTKWQSGVLEYTIKYKCTVTNIQSEAVGYTSVWGGNWLYFPMSTYSGDLWSNNLPRFIDIPTLALCQITYDGTPHNIRPYMAWDDLETNGRVWMRLWWTHVNNGSFQVTLSFKLFGHWK